MTNKQGREDGTEVQEGVDICVLIANSHCCTEGANTNNKPTQRCKVIILQQKNKRPKLSLKNYLKS